MTALCVYPLWIGIRDFPYRAHWLLLAAVGVAIAAQIPFVPAGDAGDYWILNSVLALGLALFVVGALDHLLLTRALNGGSDPADSTEQVSL